MNTQKIFSRKTLALACWASLCSMAVNAQQGNTNVDEIVVTASRSEKPLNTIPNTVTVINEAALSEQISITPDLSTILGNLIPSFSPSRQKMTSSGESLRGRNPLYMVDGVPQSNPLRNGSRDAHTIDPLMLERVEVIHGANAIHGMGAAGGIINLITRRPTEEFQRSIRVESFGQTEDLDESFGYGINATVSGRKDNKDLLASIGYRSTGISYDADGRVVGVDNTQGDTMDSDMLNLFLKAGVEFAGDQRLELTFNHYDLAGNNDWVTVNGDYANDVPTTAEKGTIPGEAGSNEITLFALNYTKDDFYGHGLRVQVFDQDFSGTYGGGVFATFQDPDYGPDIFDQSQNNSEKQGAKLTLVKDQLGSLPVSLVYGADLLRDETNQRLVQTDRKWVPPTEYENYALFGQAEYTGVERLVVTAGARYENATLNVNDFTTLYAYNGGQFVEGGKPDFSETLYNLGATYQLSNEWRLFANTSEGFSMPDVGRVLRGIDAAGQDVESFLNLQPIITDNEEVGVEYSSERLDVQLSYYTSDSDFGQRLQADADGIYTVQREKMEIEGYEFRLQWLASEADTLGLRYANTDGEYDSDDNCSVDTDLSGANMTPDRLNLSWQRSWTTMVNSMLQIHHLFDRSFKDMDGVTAIEFDGYTTVDASVDVAFGDAELRFALQNLTNEDYYTYYTQTQGNDSRNFKGFGRSFSASYRYRF